MASTTLFWHDYETSGTDPARDRPMQFAGLRTDVDLNPIEEPFEVHCRLASDVLPHPEACLITKLTPQRVWHKGLCEAEFIGKIQQQLMRPGTCAVGYNSLRFDDEVTRNCLYRNFHDPYEREWKNGNSRWDIIDMLRLTRALRPEGIEWPEHDDGLPSFRLEDLTAANSIDHGQAHDAMADVYATIAMAKLVKDKQPRLYQYAFEQRDKRRLAQLIDLVKKTPLLHVSGMLPVAQGYASMMMPIAMHPHNRNGVIFYDLTKAPDDVIHQDLDTLRDWLYTPSKDLPQGVVRPGLKVVHLNRCPILATAKLLDDASAERLNIDLNQCRQHWQQVQQAGMALVEKVTALYQPVEPVAVSDPDLMIYSGGFFSDQDRQLIRRVRQSNPEQLASLALNFDDARLPEMLFRYRARNYPETLSEHELQRWQSYRQQRLLDGEGGALTLEQYQQRLELLCLDATESQLPLLQELALYGDQIL